MRGLTRLSFHSYHHFPGTVRGIWYTLLGTREQITNKATTEALCGEFCYFSIRELWRGPYKVHDTWYTILGTRHTVHGTRYPVHDTLYTVNSIWYTVHCTLYTTPCTLYMVHTVHGTLYPVHDTLYTVHGTLYTIPCTRHTGAVVLQTQRQLNCVERGVNWSRRELWRGPTS